MLFDADVEDKEVVNYLIGAHAEPLAGQQLFVYGLHRHNGELIDLDRTHLGLSLEGQIDDFEYWLDAGWSFGREDDVDVSGTGVDFLAMYVFKDIPLDPSLFAGIAYGSGDSEPFDGSDGNFRQSGLNDNQTRLNGVTSFRYLGELARFDLSNLVVATAGIGFRPFDRTSIDFVYHRYWQDEKAAFLGPSRLRLTPTGLSSDIGQGFDVVFGFEYFWPLEVKILAGYFHPGEAFMQPAGGAADDAWFILASVKYSF